MPGRRCLGWLATAICATAACGPADGDVEPLVPGAVHRFATVVGERWHWVESGSGPPLVVLHGFPESWYAWSELVETMSSDFRVLAIDLKGAGLSSTSDGDYSVAAVADELAALLEQIGVERFYLAGHDWGGLIGARLAGEYPQRIIAYAHISAPVERYDLSRMADLRDLHDDPESATALMLNAELFVQRMLGLTLAGGIEALSVQRVQHHVDSFGRGDVRAATARYFRDLQLDDGWRLGDRARADWSRMGFPVLVVAGGRDLMVPLEEYLGMSARVPGLERVAVIDGAGHYPHEERPLEVIDILQEFFEQHE